MTPSKQKLILAALWVLSLTTLLFVSGTVIAQDIDLEQLLETDSESEDQSELVEYVQSLLDKPLNLNSASARELQTLPWITLTCARTIIEYRRKVGRIEHFSELQEIEQVTPQVMLVLRNFTTLAMPSQKERKIKAKGRQRSFARKDQESGSYSGSGEKLYNRFQGIWNDNLELGILLEKDPGEKQLNDLAIGYARLELQQAHSSLIVGHFIVETGQGLVFWGPYRTAPGSQSVSSATSKSRVIVPYRSVDENASLRGVGVRSKLHNIEMLTFYSRNDLDARIEAEAVQSLPSSGYHRTESEMQAKDRLTENIFGLHAAYKFARTGEIGVSHQQAHYDKGFAASDRLDALFDFTGQDNSITGLNGDLVFGPVNLFGEMARSRSGGLARIAGSLIDLGAFSFIASVRSYDVNYHNRHGNGLGRRGRTLDNERGFYAGWQGKWRTWTCSMFFDLYEYPWPKFNMPMPSGGYQVNFYIEKKAGKNILVSLQHRMKIEETSVDVPDVLGNSLEKISTDRTTSTRLQLDYSASSALKLRSRLQINTHKNRSGSLENASSAGVLLYQDVSHALWQKLRVSARWTFFDAPLYESRFYQYENDLPGVMRLKMLYSKGTRFYLLSAYTIHKKLKLGMKLERTFYDTSDTSPADGGLPSDMDDALSLQIDWEL